MDKEQTKIIKGFGYEIADVKGKKQPKMTMWRPEHIQGEGVIVDTGNWIEMPDLPADSRSLKNYLARGFVLKKPKETIKEE